jgi:hypothetical protein
MIYSPSQTKVYLECPTKRLLSQEGWTSRVIGLRDWVAWVGQGVHAGLAYLKNPQYKHAGAGEVLTKGVSEFDGHLDYAISCGRIVPGTFYRGEAKAQIERCLEYAMGFDILPSGFVVERVEQGLGDFNCILDVVGKRNGKPTFVDYKVKNKCKPEYIDQELEKYRYDWKEARHYPWALSQVTGQQVVEYSVVLFILQPFKVVQRMYQVNWKVVERWFDANSGIEEYIGLWEAMGDRMVPWQSNACMGGQWPCDYLDACWTYDLDREKMGAGGLVQVTRLNKQILADSQVNSEERGMV